MSLLKHHAEPVRSNADVLSNALQARVKSAVPLVLDMSGTELAPVTKRRSYESWPTNTMYGLRLAFADFVRELDVIDDVVDMELASLEDFNALVQKRPFFVALGSVPVTSATRVGDMLELAQVVSVEPSLFDRSEPAVYVKGADEKTAVLETGADLFMLKTPSPFNASDQAPPIIR